MIILLCENTPTAMPKKIVKNGMHIQISINVCMLIVSSSIIYVKQFSENSKFTNVLVADLGMG